MRGLACSVSLGLRRIFLDPGMGLGWSRQGLMPHPFQIAMGARIREEMIAELGRASDVVFTHFDGDHCPLRQPNPYQLGLESISEALSTCRVWAKGPAHASPRQQSRRRHICAAIGRELDAVEGSRDGALAFSKPMPHGERGPEAPMLMMCRIQEQGECFVHASDIQFLDSEAVDAILDWKPDCVLASGPPLYRYEEGASRMRDLAWANARRLAAEVDCLIVDHHLFRSEEGRSWLAALQRETSGRVLSAAAFMGRSPLMLEAWRQDLYHWMPVDEDWHEKYRLGLVDTRAYRLAGWEALTSNGRLRPCKWYSCCPIRVYTEEGRLSRKWIEDYCLLANKRCIRYQMEERGESHSDQLLPDGEMMEG